MIALEINMDKIRERGIIAELPNGLLIDIIYNNIDNYLYASIKDSDEHVIVGHMKVVPNIDFLAFTNNDIKGQIRCIKVNEFAEERDLVTPENLNHDYKFFWIGVENNEATI